MCDAVFDPSEAQDCCTQLVVILRDKGLKLAILFVWTDGGPDHSLKIMATKLALIATLSGIDLIHLVTLRTNPMVLWGAR